MHPLLNTQVVEVLSNVGTLQTEGDGQQQFSDAHMRTMFAAIDVDESGYVDWWVLCLCVCSLGTFQCLVRYIPTRTLGYL